MSALIHNGLVLLAGLSATGPEAEYISGTYMMAGLDPVTLIPRLLVLNADGTIGASAGSAPGGAAGGDLSGTYPNPTVAKIGGVTISGTGTTANFLRGDGAWSNNLVGPLVLGTSVGVTLSKLNSNVLQIGQAANAAPALQTIVIGEESRTGIDTDIAGANGVITSGRGTGAGAASSIIFQTPTVAVSSSTLQTVATRLTISTATITTTIQLLTLAGVLATPAISINGHAGLYATTNNLFFVISAANRGAVSTNGFRVTNTGGYHWVSGTTIDGGTVDLSLIRDAAATLRLGALANATPVAQIFIVGEASRAGTDTNVAGSTGTIRSGLGTGTGTVSTLIFQTPTVVASGSGAQTPTTRLTLSVLGAAIIGDIYTSSTAFLHRTTGALADGAAASVGTLTNAPAATNPTKWIPIDDNGTTRYIPAW